jgi:hypothetical protein
MNNRTPKNTFEAVNPENIYPLKAVVELEVLTAPSKDAQWQLLQRHIRQGKLKAVNVGSEGRPRYVVHGKDLVTYLKEYIDYDKDDSSEIEINI